MLHPQYLLDYEKHIAKIVKRLDEIRTGALKPGRTAWIDPTKILKDHDAAASRLLTALLGTVQIYTLGMSLLNATSGARAALRDLKFDLLGPLAIDGIASLAHLKNIDLARYFARFAELGAPVPRSLLATLCAEVARLTRVPVSSEVVSSWGPAPLLLADDAGADASAGLAGAVLSVAPGFAPLARVAAARAAAPSPVLAAAPAAAAACVIDKSAARQALEMLAKAVAGRTDLLARVREMEVLLDAPAPATSASPAAPPTTVSLADTAAANESSV